MTLNSNQIELSGGRSGKIYKNKDFVIRPANIWTKDVHKFLNFMLEKGANFVPKPYKITDKNEEIISFIPGDVFNYPLPPNLLKDNILISSAKLLLKFHNFGEQYINNLFGNECWMLSKQYPIETMCHGDFAPYNVTIVNDCATGIIDFDTLHPGFKMWDISYAIYRWVPFKNPNNPDSNGTLSDHIRKAKIFLDTYGTDQKSRLSFVDTLIKRLKYLINFMVSENEKGNKDFETNILSGHVKLYEDDINYLNFNKENIINGIK